MKGKSFALIGAVPGQKLHRTEQTYSHQGIEPRKPTCTGNLPLRAGQLYRSTSIPSEMRTVIHNTFESRYV